jgi:hypothetical protein
LAKVIMLLFPRLAPGILRDASEQHSARGRGSKRKPCQLPPFDAGPWATAPVNPLAEATALFRLCALPGQAELPAGLLPSHLGTTIFAVSSSRDVHANRTPLDLGALGISVDNAVDDLCALMGHPSLYLFDPRLGNNSEFSHRWRGPAPALVDALSAGRSALSMQTMEGDPATWCCATRLPYDIMTRSPALLPVARCVPPNLFLAAATPNTFLAANLCLGSPPNLPVHARNTLFLENRAPSGSSTALNAPLALSAEWMLASRWAHHFWADCVTSSSAVDDAASRMSRFVYRVIAYSIMGVGRSADDDEVEQSVNADAIGKFFATALNVTEEGAPWLHAMQLAEELGVSSTLAPIPTQTFSDAFLLANDVQAPYTGVPANGVSSVNAFTPHAIGERNAQSFVQHRRIMATPADHGAVGDDTDGVVRPPRFSGVALCTLAGLVVVRAASHGAHEPTKSCPSITTFRTAHSVPSFLRFGTAEVPPLSSAAPVDAGGDGADPQRQISSTMFSDLSLTPARAGGNLCSESPNDNVGFPTSVVGLGMFIAKAALLRLQSVVWRRSWTVSRRCAEEERKLAAAEEPKALGERSTGFVDRSDFDDPSIMAVSHSADDHHPGSRGSVSQREQLGLPADTNRDLAVTTLQFRAAACEHQMAFETVATSIGVRQAVGHGVPATGSGGSDAVAAAASPVGQQPVKRLPLIAPSMTALLTRNAELTALQSLATERAEAMTKKLVTDAETEDSAVRKVCDDVTAVVGEIRVMQLQLQREAAEQAAVRQVVLSFEQISSEHGVTEPSPKSVAVVKSLKKTSKHRHEKVSPKTPIVDADGDAGSRPLRLAIETVGQLRQEQDKLVGEIADMAEVDAERDVEAAAVDAWVHQQADELATAKQSVERDLVGKHEALQERLDAHAKTLALRLGVHQQQQEARCDSLRAELAFITTSETNRIMDKWSSAADGLAEEIRQLKLLLKQREEGKVVAAHSLIGRWDHTKNRSRPMVACGASVVVLDIMEGWCDGGHATHLHAAATVMPVSQGVTPQRHDMSTVALGRLATTGASRQMLVGGSHVIVRVAKTARQ